MNTLNAQQRRRAERRRMKWLQRKLDAGPIYSFYLLATEAKRRGLYAPSTYLGDVAIALQRKVESIK